MVRVLIVDDDETLARTLKRALATTGRVEAVAETSPHAAIARVIETGRSHERFDVVLCDSRMMGATAYDVLVAVRMYGDAAFILMSGADEMPAADANVLKPFSRDELMRVIDELMARRDIAQSTLSA